MQFFRPGLFLLHVIGIGTGGCGRLSNGNLSGRRVSFLCLHAISPAPGQTKFRWWMPHPGGAGLSLLSRRGNSCKVLALILRDDASNIGRSFLDKTSKKLPDYDAEDLETLAWSVDKDRSVPWIDADKLPYIGKWKVCASYCWNHKEHISVLETRISTRYFHKV